MKRQSPVIAMLLIAGMISQSVLAYDLGISTSNAGKGSEYTSGGYPGAVLMKVNLWGAVGKSGIHFIPTNTDLVTLLSYAGGPTDNAKITDITIKRFAKGEEQVINVNAEKLLASRSSISPILQANDIVIVPQKTQLISQDAALLVGVISALFSIVTSSILLTRHTP